MQGRRATPAHYPALAELLNAAQRQPIPEVLAKIDDAYNDVETNFRVFQERRRTSIAEQGPYTTIMSKLADEIIPDTSPTANIDGSVTNGGNSATGVIYTSTVPGSQPAKLAASTPRGSIASMRRSSQSVLAAAQLVSQMAAVTSQVAATSEQVLNGRKSGQSLANMLRDSEANVGLAAQVAGNPSARSKDFAGDLPTSRSSGPVLQGDSSTSNGRSVLLHHSTHAIASPAQTGDSQGSDIIANAVLSAAASSPLTVAPPNVNAPPRNGIESSTLSAAGTTSQADLLGTRHSTHSLNPRPPPRLEPVRAIPQLPMLGDALGFLPGMTHDSGKVPGATGGPPAPVFQVVVAGEGEESGSNATAKKQPDFEFIPVAPKLELPADMYRKARTRSMDEGQSGGAAALAAARNAAKTPTATSPPDTLASPQSTTTTPLTATAAKRWKSNAKRKGNKSSERQRRLEEGRRRAINEIPDVIRLDMIREALPVVGKMVSEYKSQLGERDEITQIAVAHFAKLQSMLSRSHAYADDGVSVMDDDGAVTAGSKTGTGNRPSMSKSGLAPSVSGLIGGGGKAVAMGGIMGPSSGGGGGMIGGMPHYGVGHGGLKVKKTATMTTTAVKKEKKLDDIMSDDEGNAGGFVSLLLPGQK